MNDVLNDCEPALARLKFVEGPTLSSFTEERILRHTYVATALTVLVDCTVVTRVTVAVEVTIVLLVAGVVLLTLVESMLEVGPFVLKIVCVMTIVDVEVDMTVLYVVVAREVEVEMYTSVVVAVACTSAEVDVTTSV